MDAKLCMTCQRVLEEFQIKLADDPGTESSSDFLFVHHHALQFVEEAVATGCDICRLLLAAGSCRISELRCTMPNLQKSYFTLLFVENQGSWSIVWRMRQSNWSTFLTQLILAPGMCYKLKGCFI
jgi:hypothetical protein